MQHQIGLYLFKSLTIVILINSLILSACQKSEKSTEEYILSREEFINKVKGEWYVAGFVPDCNYYGGPRLMISLINNYIIYEVWDTVQNHYNVFTYSIDDTVLCTLPEIENMQQWSITESANELSLKTIDLCGETKTFKIAYSDYMYQSQRGWDTVTSIIYADMKLVTSDSTGFLDNFYIDSSDSTVYMGFCLVNFSLVNYYSRIVGSFGLRRPEK